VRLSILFAVGAAALLSGCAATSVPWQNPDLPKEQWSRDWTACKRWAEAQAGYREDESSSSAFREYDRAQAKRAIAGYANLCMTDRGYVPAAKK
jgi:outer membrane biogenesis lipoprotein LolB